ncbi:hypothetical protein JCGZ_10292 [Jatropha curcas]|uniref:Uncharacterized protein n=1 Tax=Jatropha curcas TaxID=180498 RepID=A0A067KJ20_JATCU|nr:hypothetical protein JCGZ_10292 [Jatropha curcas]
MGGRELGRTTREARASHARARPTFASTTFTCASARSANERQRVRPRNSRARVSYARARPTSASANPHCASARSAARKAES